MRRRGRGGRGGVNQCRTESCRNRRHPHHVTVRAGISVPAQVYASSANMPESDVYPEPKSSAQASRQEGIWQFPLNLTTAAANRCKARFSSNYATSSLAGRLKPGTLIPASRVLAEQLGISRNTVLLVYERLIAEGYLQARKAIGTYVNLELPETCLAATRRTATSVPVHGETVKRPVIPFIGQMPAKNHAQHLDFDFCPDRIGLRFISP